MHILKLSAALGVFVCAAMMASESEAKRAGGGKTVGTTKSVPAAAKKASGDTEKAEPATAAQGASPINVNIRSGSASAAPSATPATGAAAGVAAGAAVGAAAASRPVDAANLDESRRAQRELEEKRKQELAALRKKFEDEAKARKAAEEQQKLEAAAAVDQERKRRLQEDAQRRAEIDKEKARRRAQQERESACRIRPVMTDEDIARCRQTSG